MNLSSSFKVFAIAWTFFACTSSQAEEKLSKPNEFRKVIRPSVFKKDKEGVLWFEKGDDGETKYSSAMILSAKLDGIVVVVVANEKHIKGAVGLAIKMRNALQNSKDTPDHIPVVAVKSDKPGAHYRFYSDGMFYGSRESLGVFGPADAKKHLEKVIMHHQRLKGYVARGEWGQDDAEETALQIISR